MATEIKSRYPLGAMPAKVLVGKVLMKAGADRQTLGILRSLINELEMDRKALTLTTAFPSMLWTGHPEFSEATQESAEDPERPVILFSILDRVGNQADVQQLTRTWQEQVLSCGTRNLILGAVEPSVKPMTRWLRDLRGGRLHFSALEKIFIGFLIVRLSFGLTRIVLDHPNSLSAAEPTLHPVAPISVVHTSSKTSPPVLPTPTRPKTVPVIKFNDFVYLNDGRAVIHWTPAGQRYRYRIYGALESDLKEAHPVLSKDTTSTEFVWTKTSGVNWLAIRVIDPDGRRGRFSEPTYVGLN